MLGKLVERPIAVSMTIVAILIVGIVAIGKLPISLMPDVDIPQITVQVSESGSSAREINEQVIKPLRMQLIQIPALQEIRCGNCRRLDRRGCGDCRTQTEREARELYSRLFPGR